MLEIAEFISPTPSPVWKLAKQAGVDLAVGGLPFDDLQPGEAAWDYTPLLRMKERYAAGGFKLAVIEARPPLNKAKRGLPGRDEEIATVCALLENMAKLDIPVWCYEWMTDFNWLRTNMRTPSRGGSVVTSFDYSDLAFSRTTMRGQETIDVSFVLKNTGKYAGEEVAQLYLRAMVSKPLRPVKELKDFRKLLLQPGESRRITFTVKRAELAFYNDQLKRITEPGEFRVMIGSASDDIRLQMKFNLLN